MRPAFEPPFGLRPQPETQPDCGRSSPSGMRAGARGMARLPIAMRTPGASSATIAAASSYDSANEGGGAPTCGIATHGAAHAACCGPGGASEFRVFQPCFSGAPAVEMPP